MAALNSWNWRCPSRYGLLNFRALSRCELHLVASLWYSATQWCSHLGNIGNTFITEGTQLIKIHRLGFEMWSWSRFHWNITKARGLKLDSTFEVQRANSTEIHALPNSPVWNSHTVPVNSIAITRQENCWLKGLLHNASCIWILLPMIIG